MNEEALTVDGYDDCIIGIGQRFGIEPFFIYDEKKMLEKMVNEDGMTYEEAVDFFEYNILGAYISESNPAFMIQ